jgi:hypothetical protein
LPQRRRPQRRLDLFGAAGDIAAVRELERGADLRLRQPRGTVRVRCLTSDRPASARNRRYTALTGWAGRTILTTTSDGTSGANTHTLDRRVHIRV